jgi:eukaryotic-like serine/threonine-protein kinase
MIGSRLSHYEILDRIGEGGMGVVYKARDTHLDRLVAIKILPADKVSNADRRRRFVQEARAASALNHPGIVTIHDIAEEHGVDFIAMELVAGRTLDRVIPRGGLRLRDALDYGFQIADAIAAAHAGSIVHRDLKPSNVMVTDHGQVKLLDFGLAKLVDRGTLESAALTATSPAAITIDGAIVGTVAYMAPEQAEGKSTDPRADIFSFGAQRLDAVGAERAVLTRRPPHCVRELPFRNTRGVGRRCRRTERAAIDDVQWRARGDANVVSRRSEHRVRSEGFRPKRGHLRGVGPRRCGRPRHHRSGR